MSKLGIINFCLTQWLFFRVAMMKHDDGRIQWALLYPVIPLTGWFSSYVPKKFKVKKLNLWSTQ